MKVGGVLLIRFRGFTWTADSQPPTHHIQNTDFVDDAAQWSPFTSLFRCWYAHEGVILDAR